MNGDTIDLSEMYFVHLAYQMKAENYILRQGTARFSEGGLIPEVIDLADRRGLVPQSAYTGLVNGETKHDHAKMFAVLEKVVKPYANPANKLSGDWRKKVRDILDSCMGQPPGMFAYRDYPEMMPQELVRRSGIRESHYIHVTSVDYTDYYDFVVLPIPANWSGAQFYNYPLEEFTEVIDYALDHGFTLAIDLDGTEPTFDVEEGIATWPGKNITRQQRMAAFDNFSTTDDHLMHIVGTVKDQHGEVYYKAKNSWGPKAGKNGYMYLSKDYVRMKGISVTLNREGLKPDR